MRFGYFEPSSVEEAVDILRQGNGGYKALAGGTDVIIHLRRRAKSYEALVNIKRLPGISGWSSKQGEGLHIGAATPFRSLETSPSIAEEFPALGGVHTGHRLPAAPEHGHRRRQPLQRLALGGQRARVDGGGGHRNLRGRRGRPTDRPRGAALCRAREIHPGTGRPAAPYRRSKPPRDDRQLLRAADAP